jgi:hypothetical protein
MIPKAGPFSTFIGTYPMFQRWLRRLCRSRLWNWNTILPGAACTQLTGPAGLWRAHGEHWMYRSENEFVDKTKAGSGGRHPLPSPRLR